MSSKFCDNIADEKAPPKGGAFGLPYRLFEMLFSFIFLHETACMKQRFFGAQGAEGFPLPAPLTSFFDRERKRFLAFARNDDTGDGAIRRGGFTAPCSK